MGGKSIEALVKPDLLKWARESIGMNIDQVSQKIKKTDPKTIQNWESGIVRPTISQAEKLAKIYKRPLAAFYLPEPPKEAPLPRDFRTLPLDKIIPFSRDTRLAIRKARRVQSLMKELNEEMGIKLEAKIHKVGISEDPEKLASRIRKNLGMGIEDQFKWKNESEAFRRWRKKVEEENILVLQISMPLNETRGFSLSDKEVPIIVINAKDAVNARIFSLFHEYAHLLIQISGICDMRELFQPNRKDEEVFCNRFAGALLVPKDKLLDQPMVQRKQFDDESLMVLAFRFKVSKEVILRRLVILERVSPKIYQQKRKEWEAEYQRLGKRTGGRRNRPKECIREYGMPFVSLVINAYREGKITYGDITDYLSIKAKYLPKVENLAKKFG